MRQVARFLVSNSAKEFTYSSLKSVTRVKNQITLTNWVRYLEEAYLLFKVERFSYKLKQTIIAPKKIYCVDNGLIREAGLAPTENRGRLMENIVALELIKKSMNESEFELSYWKDHSGKEVDFVIRNGRHVDQLVQVTYASSLTAVNRRELDALAAASKNLNCDNLLVLTWDYEDSTGAGGKKVSFMPLWKWLLQ